MYEEDIVVDSSASAWRLPCSKRKKCRTRIGGKGKREAQNSKGFLHLDGEKDGKGKSRIGRILWIDYPTCGLRPHLHGDSLEL